MAKEPLRESTKSQRSKTLVCAVPRHPIKRAARSVVGAEKARAPYSEDLEVRKVYEILPDASAAKEGYFRVIDESGEDYLYPKSLFLSITVPQSVRKAILEAA